MWGRSYPAAAIARVEWSTYARSYAAPRYRPPHPSQRCCPKDTGPAPDVEAIHHLIEQYTQAVDTVDLNLLSQIWSHSPEVSFIYPLGEEDGFDAIETAGLSKRNGRHVLGTRS